MEDTARTHLLESLIGVSASRRTYYSEYRENERRLDRAIDSLAIISAALCKTTSGVAPLAHAVAQVAAQHFDAAWAAVVLSEEPARHWLVHRGHDGALTLDTRWVPAALEQAVAQALGQAPPAHEVAGVRCVAEPMCLSDKVVGALVVALNPEFVMDEREQSVLRTLANQAAVAVENARLYEESEQLRARAFALYEDTYRQKTELEEKNRQLAKARDRLAAARKTQILNDERARIARDLHDSVAQHLISIGMTLEWCRVQLDPASQTYARICNAKELARSAVTRMRETIFQLAPVGGRQSTLVDVLRELALDFEKTSSLRVKLNAVGEAQRLSAGLVNAIYYIAQEALFNAYKHAQAANIAIELHISGAGVRLVVADDGVGMARHALELAAPAHGDRGHFGLRNMRERVGELGGELRIVLPDHGGTELHITIPCAA